MNFARNMQAKNITWLLLIVGMVSNLATQIHKLELIASALDISDNNYKLNSEIVPTILLMLCKITNSSSGW